MCKTISLEFSVSIKMLLAFKKPFIWLKVKHKLHFNKEKHYLLC